MAGGGGAAIAAAAAAVVEVPLLFESGMEGGFDATIAILADEDVRAERAGVAGSSRRSSERSARQLSQQEKAHRATYVVINDGTVEELEAKLSAVLDMLRDEPARRHGARSRQAHDRDAPRRRPLGGAAAAARGGAVARAASRSVLPRSALPWSGSCSRCRCSRRRSRS